MVAKMTKGGIFSYLRAYLTHITPYKLFIRLFFVEKQKLVVHPHKNVQRVFFIYIGSFDTPSFINSTTFRLNHPKKIPIFAISTYTLLRKGGAGMKKLRTTQKLLIKKLNDYENETFTSPNCSPSACDCCLSTRME